MRYFQKSQQKRILVVEDEPDLQSLYTVFLKRHGYDVCCAGTLQESRDRLKEAQFDLLLQDVVLPDGNGVEAIAELRTLYPDLPVVVLTALGYDEKTLQTALRNGASSYVSKILPLDQVLMEIHRILNYAK